MIYDSLNNFREILGVHRLFSPVWKYLKNHNLKNLPAGRHSIGNGIIAMMNAYDTKKESEAKMECHEKYIDIQIMVSGEENIGVCRKEKCKKYKYMEETDFQELKGKYDLMKLEKNCFFIFFPQDGHMPGLQINHKKKKVIKVVFKVPV
jgi:YhcH/YjgK/YiaL family protein